MNPSGRLELLAPASGKEAARQAILHGADAVYIGAPSHGARKSASNNIDDITEIVDFAHQYRARVYVTVNTIIYDNELAGVREMCRNLYHAGVDALIVQDMGILRMDIPPIELHASTQCDIRTPEKALFLEKAGFSQIVLERGLSLNEIKRITEAVSIPVECFVHGALCVSYSGKCHISCHSCGRSGNRGECAQICRLPFDLIDADGNFLVKDKYLLSLKDLNLEKNLDELVEAGVSSFKIEGRLKDISYVKNITSFYNDSLNRIIDNSEGKYKRSSFGEAAVSFNPDPAKSFNRGFTDFMLKKKSLLNIGAIDTPKSKGEPVRNIKMLNNGDGISFFDKDGNFTGALVNGISGSRIITGNRIEVPQNVDIYRTFDKDWEKKLAKETAVRKINIEVAIDPSGLSASDEMGNRVRIPWSMPLEKARNPFDYEKEFAKTGNTVFHLRSFVNNVPFPFFVPKSIVSDLRRRLLSLLSESNKINYTFGYRRKETPGYPFISDKIDYRENVANSLATQFYKDHGVKDIEPALEIQKDSGNKSRVLMTTRHCILREIGLCKKIKNKELHEPLFIVNGSNRYKLDFNCNTCEMKVLSQG